MTEESRNMPLVSIIITSYNRAKWIKQAIESALLQNYDNYEIVISDNCSTDNTEEIVAGYLEDKRVKFYKNEVNIGMMPNFKKAIEVLAKGEYFVILNSDDLLSYPDFIQRAIKIVNSYKDINCVKGKARNLFEESGEIIDAESGSLFEKEHREGIHTFLNYNGTEDLSWAGILIKRDIFNSLNIFEENYTALDVASNLMLMLIGNIGFINEYCYIFRVHGTNAHIQIDAKHCIDNLMMVNKPYQFALTKNIIDKNRLDVWRHVFLKRLIKDTLKQLYIIQKPEFQKFETYIRVNYPAVFNEINSLFRWKLFLLFYIFPPLGKTLAGVKKTILKVK